MKSSSLSFLVLLLSVLGGCIDHKPVDPLRWRVKRLTQILPENDGLTNISTFKYDAQNRLISVVSYQTPDSSAAVIGRTSYEYDDQNRLLVVKRSVNPYGSEEYKYAYNVNGQLTTLDYDAGVPDTYHVTFIYSDGRLVSSLRKFDFFSSLRFKSELFYTFSGQNLSKVNSIQTIEKVIPFVSTNSSTFTYDNKINPFYGVYLVPAPVLPARPTSGQFNYYTYYGGYDNLLTLSPVNMLSETKISGDETHYEYQYNDAGYPTNRVTTKKSFGQPESQVAETLMYEYENY